MIFSKLSTVRMPTSNNLSIRQPLRSIQGGDVTHVEKESEVDELAQSFKRLMRPRMREYARAR